MMETRKLNTILFADIMGYTSIMHNNEKQAMKYLQKFKSLLQDLVPRHNGLIVQYFGDACLLSFDSTTAGVNCAVSLQKEFIEADLPIRIGMHLGEVVFTENNVFGDGVNIASRIESMGVPGSVLVSNAIRNQIKNKDEFNLKSLGSFEFKNVPDPIEVFALDIEGLSVPEKSNMAGKFKEPIKGSKKNVWYAAGVAAIIALFFILDFFHVFHAESQNEPLGALAENSIAVLPLINLNNSNDVEYFSDGLTQEIIDELAKISSISVSAFSTTYQYRNREKPMNEIAEELGATYLISGSSRFFNEENRIKISIELINPVTKERIWFKTFDEEMKDVPNIQLIIAKQVAENLNIRLTNSEKEGLEKPNTNSGEAFRLYLHAKAEISKLSPAGFAKGQEYLEEALEIDPNYAQAYTLLGWSYAVGGSADLSGINRSTSETVKLASPYIEKAIALDPKMSDSYLVRANLKLYSQNRIQDAIEDVELAFEINSWPRIPTDYCICTAISAYIALNDLIKATEVAKLAKEIDPEHILYDWDLGNIALLEGNYVQAQEHFQESVRKADHPLFTSSLGLSYYYNEQYEEALQYLNRAYENSSPGIRLAMSALSNVYFKLGDLDKSDQYLNELLERSEEGEYHLNLFIANIYLERNEISKALDYLEMGVEDSDFGFSFFLRLLPEFKSLENEPRYEKVLDKIQV
jgi:TolB-like protein/class 3 adenylate cyclase/Flp pilus assembly protein TadD